MRKLLAWSLSCALAGTAAAQHPCLVNLVPNGDFESVLFDPWVPSGPVQVTPVSTRVNGVELSYALRAVGTASNSSFVLRQPTTFSLASGVAYEFSLDIGVSVSTDIDVGITTNGTRTSIYSASAVGGLRRLSAIFTPSASGAYAVDIRISNHFGGQGAGTWLVDNATVRVFQSGAFTFYGDRNLTRVASQPFRVVGPANRLLVVFLSGAGFGTPFPAPPCANDWMLALPAYQFVLGSSDQNGVFQATVTVPTSVRGVPLFWQTVFGPPSCVITCPVMIGFE